ncbi:hypothetical protein PU629_15135 [Pullulanibacillus sp. KACC 23026]|nr:hypothetical protein [Pullulanibacillus sp. KACC 23026]WEG11482.1 hypothetical protein PU629_15135 [Pullulanibacillus sp. KACC 23026]
MEDLFPFIKSLMNAKKREWGSRKGVHQGDERQNEWMRQPKGRSSKG